MVISREGEHRSTAPTPHERPGALRVSAALNGTKRTIVLNAGSLVGTFGTTSLLGAAFWWVAAREYSPENVGFASAAVSGMTLLAGVTTLGLSTLLIGEVHRQKQAAALLAVALTVAGVVGAALGLAYAVSIPRLIGGLRPLSASPLNIGVFMAGVAGVAIGNVLDAGLIGLLLGRLQLLRNVLFGVAKLAILAGFAFALARPSGTTILAAWALGATLALMIPAVVGARRIRRGFAGSGFPPQWSSIRQLGGIAAGHQVLNLALVTPGYILPLLVVGLLSARATASFYIAWMIAGVVFFIPSALTQILFAIGAGEPDALAGESRMTLGISVLASALAIPIFAIGASPILGVFGATYADSASWTLRLLVVAVLPLSVKNHYLALVRIRRRLRSALPLVWGGAAAEVALAALGARVSGLDGLSLGWLLAVVSEAAVMAWPVYHGLLGYGSGGSRKSLARGRSQG